MGSAKPMGSAMPAPERERETVGTALSDGSLGSALLGCARGAIGAALGRRQPSFPGSHPALDEPGASFVTLTRDGALRGCIGSLEPHRPLVDDVRANAVAAALRDPRFAPLSASEFGAILIEVSVLGPSEPLEADSEPQALRSLRPFEDGVILSWREHRATFLPQVWQVLPQPGDFLRELRRKAGLAADFWSPELRLSRYRVAKWREAGPVGGTPGEGR